MKTFWVVSAALLTAFLFSGRASSVTQVKDTQLEQFQKSLTTQADANPVFVRPPVAQAGMPCSK